MMDPTEKYIQEHRYVFSLPRKKIIVHRKEKAIGWSISRLLKAHVFSALRCIKRYPQELWKGRRDLARSVRLRNSGHGKLALVIGNGPSQGYLNVDILNEFVKNGGETYCVNYWPSNQKLSSHIPTWIIFSDPETFKSSDKAQVLIDYLKLNSSIKIAVPVSFTQDIKRLNLENEYFVFINSELTLWKNISPLFPRGYISMTLYKALAWAVHLGYSKIGVIGMDNTYPHNIFNDEDNHICNLETHSGIDDYLVDQSDFYENVAARLDSLSRLFYHLSYFPDKSIVNLDPYSLTDAFDKLSLSDFIQQITDRDC